jgi:hypothetical protein
MWAKYCDPASRELAISIVDDELGYPMLSYKGRSPSGSYCWMAIAGARTADGWIDTDASIGAPHRRQAQGLPAEQRYSDLHPSYSEPAARVAKLDDWGVDECFVFPQWGLEFEGLFFDDDLEGLRVNHGAWNRFAADISADGGGRLHPVGYLSLQGNQDWVTAQIESMARSGIRLASFTPALINGVRMSHPDNDPIWRAFVDNGITIAPHVGVGVPRFLPKAWTENDHGAFSLIGMGWMDAAVQVMLADFAFNGVFMNNPELRIAVVEQRSGTWLPKLLPRLDGAYMSQPALTAGHLLELEALPSEYIRRQCRFGLLPGEDAVGAIEAVGEVFGFGADYPHVEGVANSITDFKAELPRPLAESHNDQFYGGNAMWALGG